MRPSSLMCERRRGGAAGGERRPPPRDRRSRHRDARHPLGLRSFFYVFFSRLSFLFDLPLQLEEAPARHHGAEREDRKHLKPRSEERRVGKERRTRWPRGHKKKKR